MIENWIEYSFYKFPKSKISDFIKVRKYLIELARKETNTTVTYTQLRDDCKIDCDFGFNTNIITDILNDIFHYEFLCKRRFLTILIVSKNSELPTNYFFKNVKIYGGNKLNLSDELFFEYERNKVVEYWKNDNNYNKFNNYIDLTRLRIEYLKNKVLK